MSFSFFDCHRLIIYKCQRIPKGQTKMDNPEKLATQGTQDKEKQSKNTTQYELNITLHKETQTTSIRRKPSYKQLQAKTNLLSCIE